LTIPKAFDNYCECEIIVANKKIILSVTRIAFQKNGKHLLIFMQQLVKQSTLPLYNLHKTFTIKNRSTRFLIFFLYTQDKYFKELLRYVLSLSSDKVVHVAFTI